MSDPTREPLSDDETRGTQNPDEKMRALPLKEDGMRQTLGDITTKSKDTIVPNIIVEVMKGSSSAENAVGAAIIQGSVNKRIFNNPTIYMTPPDTRITDAGHTIPELLKQKMENATFIFEKTKGYFKVFQALEDHGHVVIGGSPGSGKTTLSLYLMLEYWKLNYRLKYEEDMREFKLRDVDLEKPTLLVFDDVFGCFSFTQDAYHNYPKLFKDIEDHFRHVKNKRLDKHQNASGNQHSMSPFFPLKVIFSTRTNILEHVAPLLGQFRGHLFNPKSVFDLTSSDEVKLDVEEKKKILQKHLRKHNITLDDDDDVDKIANEDYGTLGFPYICQLFVENETYRKSAVDFFRQPLGYLNTYIQQIFHRQECKSTAAVMLHIMLKDGNLNLTDLDTYTDREVQILYKELGGVIPQLERDNFLLGMKTEALNHRQTFLKKKGDIVTFSHPTIYDTVAFVVGSVNHMFVLKNCSLKFIVERVKIATESGGKTNSENEYDFVIELQPQSGPKLIDRLAKEVIEGNFALALSHDCLREENNAKHLLERISSKGNLNDILHWTDERHECCFLFWISFTRNNALCSLVMSDIGLVEGGIVERINFDEKEIFEALLGNCMNGNLKGIQILLKHNDAETLIAKVNSISLGDILQKHEETKHAYRKIATTSTTATRNEISVDLDVPRMHGDKSDKLIHIAAANGYTNIVIWLLGKRVDIDSVGGTMMTPLMYACYLGHKELAESLLKSGADVQLLDTEGDNCLHLVSRAGFPEIADLLIQAGVNINSRGFHDRTPLMFASQHGKLDVVRFLLANDADPEPDLSCVTYKDNCLHLAAREGHTDIVRVLIEQAHMNIETGGTLGRTALMVACRRGCVQTAQYLVSKGANLSAFDDNHFSCLHIGTLSGHIRTVEWLLDKGLQKDCLNIYKRTPLMYAFRNGHSETVNLLLREGANVELRDEKGNACIHFAAQSGISSLVDMCLSFGQDMNCATTTGVTPFLAACQFGQIPMTKFLLNKGANVTLTDDEGRSCSHFACYGGHLELVKVLQESHVFDISSLDSSGLTPFLSAVKADKANIVEYLLHSEPSLKSKTYERGQNAVHIACIHGAVKTVTKLIQAGINANALDDDLKTPLMLAACHEKSKVDAISTIVLEGEDTTERDRTKTTCFSCCS